MELVLCTALVCTGSDRCDVLSCLCTCALHHWARSAQALAPDEWGALERSVLARGSCQLTGTPASQSPLGVLPQWRYDEPSKRFVLMGALAASELLVQASMMSPVLARSAVCQLLTTINAFRQRDLEAYLAYVEGRRNQLAGQEGQWSVDLSWAKRAIAAAPSS
jgi:hypothetical protein